MRGHITLPHAPTPLGRQGGPLVQLFLLFPPQKFHPDKTLAYMYMGTYMHAYISITSTKSSVFISLLSTNSHSKHDCRNRVSDRVFHWHHKSTWRRCSALLQPLLHIYLPPIANILFITALSDNLLLDCKIGPMSFSFSCEVTSLSVVVAV